MVTVFTALVRLGWAWLTQWETLGVCWAVLFNVFQALCG